jgi:hypothetical protein
LIVICISKEVDLALANINVATTIKLSTHIDASPHVAIISSLPVLF